MDKTKLGAAAAALLSLPLAGAATAATEPAIPSAASYADLLQPIPNASERLARADSEEPPARLIPAQIVVAVPHHHHHHWRRWRRRHYHHHHHHAQVVPQAKPYV